MILSILIAKLTAKILRLFNKGATTLPGRVALFFKYDVLNRLSKGVKIICITGTNGKTTSCALIEHALKAKGCSYFINKSGANMISGVATAFIMNCNIFGKCKKEYAILECDENSLPVISRYLDAKVIAVTNVFRDQLDRYGEINHTLSAIKKGILNMPDATLVLNADCPLTYSLSEECENEVITFGINADFETSSVSDSRFCPICQHELVYKSRIYAQLGDYYCEKCAFKRVFPDVCAEDIAEINELGSTFFINYENKKEFVSTSLGGIYNIYNYCCAKAVLKTLGIDEQGILNGFSGAFGRMERFNNEGQNILLLLVKNPVGFSNCINFVRKMQGEFNMAFALNDNDADGRDVSWIWDTDFKKLSSKGSKIYTIGTRSFDMALRLKYDGITTYQTIDGEDYSELIEIIKRDDKDFVIFSNYTSMMNMRKAFVDAFGGKEFWE